MRLGKIFSIYIYGVVLTNHNILNRINNVHPIIIVLEVSEQGGI